MKAIALISGGLDSLLAASLIKRQGIEVVGLKFKIPFCSNKRKTPLELGIEIKEVDICDDFLDMVKDPSHGYGSNMNPCVDCKILMLRKAGELMKEYGASFIITGEVLGQRPMSQHKRALNNIVKKSGFEGLILRPLSARLLEETIPEKEGWVKRDALLNFSGRGRKQQISLAEDFGIKEYAQPAGGCLLTDSGFSGRLKDLMAHEGLNRNNVELLKLGRHFRLNDATKIIVGRDKEENKELLNLAQPDDYLFLPTDKLAGPTSLGRGDFNQELINISCAITCSYCDIDAADIGDIIYRRIPAKESRVLRIKPIDEDSLLSLRI